MYYCPKCNSKNIFVKQDEKIKEDKEISMDDFDSIQVVPLIYKMTTLVCEECGYEVSK